MNSKFDPARLQELLEIICGTRPGSKKQAAVRIEDFTEVLNLPQMQTKTLTAAPTMADFNSLLGDVKSINKALTALAQAIQQRERR